jgi:hypothetical protein
LVTRHGTRLTLAFPEIQDALYDHLPARTILDGEFVCWAGERLDFATVSRRAAAGRWARELARTAPCVFIVFDALMVRGRELWREPLATRRRVLEELFAEVPGTAHIALTLQSGDHDEIALWLEVFPDHGIEGLVLKDVRESYQFGRRRWWKLKHYDTCEAIIAGALGTQASPSSLLLGRYDTTGRLRLQNLAVHHGLGCPGRLPDQPESRPSVVILAAVRADRSRERSSWPPSAAALARSPAREVPGSGSSYGGSSTLPLRPRRAGAAGMPAGPQPYGRWAAVSRWRA